MWRERLAICVGAILQGISWLAITAGALGFWFADRALREFAHMPWALAEILGTGGSIVLIVLGFGLRMLRDS